MEIRCVLYIYQCYDCESETYLIEVLRVEYTGYCVALYFMLLLTHDGVWCTPVGRTDRLSL